MGTCQQDEEDQILIKRKDKDKKIKKHNIYERGGIWGPASKMKKIRY